MVDLWNSGDIETWLDEVGPDFVFTPDPTFPDVGVYRGEALREWMRDWVRTWKDNRFELLDYSEIGDASLCRSRWHLAAPVSGEGVPVQDFTVIVWWDSPNSDLPSGMSAFFEHEEALAAVKERTG
jgi:ketosteroid isomerase-like protein